MVKTQTETLLRYVRRAELWLGDNGVTDAELLDRFVAARDEAAFEALLRRHGPMVLGVCRRVLPCSHDAEDAFQATFLVLVRKAASVAKRESVGSWLHGVAYRTAQKARSTALRRRAKEKQIARSEAVYPPDNLWLYLRPMIDRELNALPEKYRELIVLCDLEGQTRKEAARRLGYPEGTVSGRLSRARVMLAKRLARYGHPLSAGLLAQVLTEQAAAGVPASLTTQLLQAAAVAAGYAVRGAISAPVAALTQGVLRAMLLRKVKTILTLLLTIGLCGAGFGLYQTQAADDGGNSSSGPAQRVVDGDKPVQNDNMPAINLPKGQPPIQVLASIDDGKLVIKTAVMQVRGIPGGVAPPAPALPPAPDGGGDDPVRGPAQAPEQAPVPGPNAQPLPAQVQIVWGLQSQTYDLDDVKVLDTKGKQVDKKTVTKMLKKETVAVASMWGEELDPLHLRVIREGTLVFVLPAPRGGPGMILPGGPPQILPLPAPPGAAPGAPGAGGGTAPSSGPAAPATGTGIAQPGTATPEAPPGPVDPR